MNRPLTGKRVFIWFAGFFMIIFLANAVMISLAFNSWTGVEIESTYNFSQQYQNVLDDAKRQESLGWRISVEAERDGNGRTRVSVAAMDREGANLDGYEVVAIFERPTQSAEDLQVVLAATGSGTYDGVINNVGYGQWDIVIDIMSENARVFRSRNRVYLESKSEQES